MKKIVAIDIDGVLNDYPQTWIDFVNSRIGSSFTNLNDMKSSLTQRRYSELKKEYRTSGIKATLPLKEHAYDFLQFLRSKNYFVVVMTSRPIEEYNELLFQTTEWLNTNDLEYDFLYFSKRKHLDIIEKFKSMEFMVEDNRSFANDVSKHGYRVFLMNNEYNVGETNPGVIRVDSLAEIIEYLKKEKHL